MKAILYCQIKTCIGYKSFQLSLLGNNWVPFMLHFTFWAWKSNSVKRLYLLQEKPLRIMFFHSRNSQTGPLVKVSKILKSFDKTALENWNFISKSLKGLLSFLNILIYNLWNCQCKPILCQFSHSFYNELNNECQ